MVAARTYAKRFTRDFLRSCAFTLVLNTYCSAATINVGQHVLLPNTANQKISIWIGGGEPIAGEDFYAQIGDGGTFLGGANSKPKFTNVDIIASTVFSSNNNGTFGDPNGTPAGNNGTHPLIWVDGTTTSSGVVSAAGLLATLTLDTTGLNSGAFPLLLVGVANSLGPFDTTLRDAIGSPIPLSVTNGMLLVATPISGDYNRNGVVDAADYTIWRDTLGSTTDLRANGTNVGGSAGVIDQADYTVWKANFGIHNGSGATMAVGVPETSTLALCCMANLIVFVARRR